MSERVLIRPAPFSVVNFFVAFTASPLTAPGTT